MFSEESIEEYSQNREKMRLGGTIQGYRWISNEVWRNIS
jgi:hypothetical protein